MAFNLKVSGVWKNAVPYLRVAGVWKATTAWLKVSGVWKVITQIYNPPGGPVNAYQYGGTASLTLTSQIPVTWTYTLVGGGSPGGSVDQASGYVGTSITFSQAVGGVGTTRINNWNVAANVSGYPTENWTVNLEADNS